MNFSDARGPQAIIDPQLIDQAIAWSVRLRLRATNAGEHQAFEAWRRADPRHEAAWRRIETMQQDMQHVRALPPQLAGQVLAASAQGAVGRRRNAMKLMLGGAMVGTAVYAGRDSAWIQMATADYSTGVGHRRTVQLDDGSQLVLNTDTAVNVRYEASRRLIEVRRGEILVTTGRDAASSQRRPFMVSTDDGMMLAKGTKFLVRKETGQTRLTVLEHAVELTSAAGTAPVLAQAGDSLYMSRQAIWKADAVDFDPVAWTEGVIAAREMRMDQFIAELSRYRKGLLRCDPAVAALPVSGVFQLQDTDRTIDVLLATQPVAARFRTRYWVTIIARQPG
ncbi:FecR domain-containing protein [Herbaspirillum sp. alder98]|uniref:FecR domain-containing protein n=1 Tax=Herbaspirillum sp. alder98 TaxID=2913096 RepID=UPI001CD88A80|nr:FecR domain-containing protein [Herbaspirillum sp. alder98]MCA1323374.1 FecR domain-containing protein [Herbaspirillum sp. alder98]